jgi:hypothetical protein
MPASAFKASPADGQIPGLAGGHVQDLGQQRAVLAAAGPGDEQPGTHDCRRDQQAHDDDRHAAVDAFTGIVNPSMAMKWMIQMLVLPVDVPPRSSHRVRSAPWRAPGPGGAAAQADERAQAGHDVAKPRN